MARQFDPNLTPATGEAAIAALVGFLCGRGWIFKKWSSGIIVSAVNPATSSITDNPSVLASTGAWVIIQQPAGGAGAQAGTREWAFIRNTTSNVWYMRYSFSGGFTAAASQTATSPGSPTDGADCNSNQQIFPANGTYRMQLGMDDAAPWWFYLLTYDTGVTLPTLTAIKTFIAIDMGVTGTYPTTNGADDPDPVITWCHYVPHGGATTNQYLWGHGNNIKGWLKKGMAGQGFVSIPLALPSTENGAANANSGVNPHNELVDLEDVTYRRYSNQQAPSGYKMESSFIKLRGPALTLGDPITYGGNTYMVFDHLTLPFPAATALLI